MYNNTQLRNSGLLVPPNDEPSDENLIRLYELLGARSGIKLTASKRTNIKGRLKKRAISLGYDSISNYCHFLFGQGGLAAEFNALIDLTTTNKTDFFRERAHFDILQNELVPTLLDARRPSESKRLKIWSAASSNGAEAYTIAMVLAGIVGQRTNLQFSILGTDISNKMVVAARRAVFPASMADPIPTEMRIRFLMCAHKSSPFPEVRIVPELRSHVSFQNLNLMDSHYPVDRDIDVIFLRNVLIYFESAVQEAVVSRLIDHLRPGGYLILGHTEAAVGSSMGFTQVATGVSCHN